ncbi:hypothetical protein PV10_01211 [Exophiala mesophila]|uniref:Macro domain-containing protein n=1 Tax=Exophiala mesophila TaxID=212818 RepID=A0A0D1X6K7_EXOME|nr:uncharacterized protein PV10_01211 [Exophiala mesophila]KIV97460.1 hypothetical protein PV10_01211 [Exophiala mesophila]
MVTRHLCNLQSRRRPLSFVLKMTSRLVALKDIPSISALYRSGELRPSSSATGLPPANQSFNDKICTYQGDITVLQVDAIVNAANKGLRGGGGVDGAIQRAAGPGLLQECKTLGGCQTGSAKITDAYNLPAKKVIHAVGPIFEDLEESEPLLRGCYNKSLSLAVENNLRSIAFPAISTGVYGYPSNDAARAAVEEVRAFLMKSDGDKLDKIIFCNFLDKDVSAYAKHIPTSFPPTEQDLAQAGSE